MLVSGRYHEGNCFRAHKVFFPTAPSPQTNLDLLPRSELIKACSNPPPVWKCPGLGRVSAGMLGTSCIERAVVLSNLLFLYSQHPRLLGQWYQAVLSHCGCQDTLLLNNSQMAVAVLGKHAVYASFCSRKKQWSGQVRNAFLQLFDARHTALHVLAKFCQSTELHIAF